jgi:hypothetical protein
MQTLLTVIVLWLSANFDLPATYQHPRIEFASPASIVGLHSQNFPRSMTGNLSREIVAVYGIETDTIYLPEKWVESNPVHLSMLVHEMTHSLQKKANLKYECDQESERVAYEAQERWLRLFGKSLEKDFGIDPLLLLVLTNCHLP